MNFRRQSSGKVDSGTIGVVIEDDQSLSMIMKHMLQAFGFDVEMVTDDGKLAVRYLSERKVGLVLLDLQMDKLSGQETLKQIKGQMPDQKVVVMSGDITPELRSELTLLGADEVIQKPFAVAELESMLFDLKLLH